MASGDLLSIGLQLGHPPYCPPEPVTPTVLRQMDEDLLPDCPAERKRIDMVYVRFVQEKGCAPYGFELWDAHQEALGEAPLYLSMRRYHAILGEDVDGNAISWTR
jgi:hypothetical protein